MLKQLIYLYNFLHFLPFKQSLSNLIKDLLHFLKPKIYPKTYNSSNELFFLFHLSCSPPKDLCTTFSQNLWDYHNFFCRFLHKVTMDYMMLLVIYRMALKKIYFFYILETFLLSDLTFQFGVSSLKNVEFMDKIVRIFPIYKISLKIMFFTHPWQL